LSSFVQLQAPQQLDAAALFISEALGRKWAVCSLLGSTHFCVVEMHARHLRESTSTFRQLVLTPMDFGKHQAHESGCAGANEPALLAIEPNSSRERNDQ
jgi:hypothetical protein